MKKFEVHCLRNGDEVYWTDPDNGEGSRFFTIQTIKINGEVISITDKRDGSEIECYAEELS